MSERNEKAYKWARNYPDLNITEKAWDPMRKMEETLQPTVHTSSCTAEK